MDAQNNLKRFSGHDVVVHYPVVFFVWLGPLCNAFSAGGGGSFGPLPLFSPAFSRSPARAAEDTHRNGKEAFRSPTSCSTALTANPPPPQQVPARPGTQHLFQRRPDLILAVWILAAKLPNSDFNFAVDFLLECLSSCLFQGKRPEKTTKNPPQNSPRALSEKIPLWISAEAFS